jgi:hypothetical protein
MQPGLEWTEQLLSDLFLAKGVATMTWALPPDSTWLTDAFNSLRMGRRQTQTSGFNK